MYYGSYLKEKLIQTPAYLYSDTKPSEFEDEFISKKKGKALDVSV